MKLQYRGNSCAIALTNLCHQLGTEGECISLLISLFF